MWNKNKRARSIRGTSVFAAIQFLSPLDTRLDAPRLLFFIDINTHTYTQNTTNTINSTKHNLQRLHSAILIVLSIDSTDNKHKSQVRKMNAVYRVQTIYIGQWTKLGVPCENVEYIRYISKRTNYRLERVRSEDNYY